MNPDASSDETGSDIDVTKGLEEIFRIYNRVRFQNERFAILQFLLAFEGLKPTGFDP